MVPYGLKLISFFDQIILKILNNFVFELFIWKQLFVLSKYSLLGHANLKSMIIYLYKKKQDIRIYVPFSRPNGWTEWTKRFWVNSCVARGVTKAKESSILFSKLIIFSTISLIVSEFFSALCC